MHSAICVRGWGGGGGSVCVGADQELPINWMSVNGGWIPDESP